MISKDITLKVDGIDIVGALYRPSEGKAYPAVCVCHGIPAGGAPDPGDRGYAGLAERICELGFSVLIFNFRGSGNSGGNLDVIGWTRDLKVMIDYLSALDGVDGSHLALLGFSAGAAVSIYVAAGDKRVSSVIACACPAEFKWFEGEEKPQSLVKHFREIGAIRDDDFPHSVKEWYSGLKLVKPIEYIAQIAPRPLFIIHGSNDETVGLSDAYRLYERAGEPKQISVIEGAGHRLRRDERAVALILDWLRAQS